MGHTVGNIKTIRDVTLSRYKKESNRGKVEISENSFSDEGIAKRSLLVTQYGDVSHSVI